MRKTRLGRFYGNTRWLYGPVHFVKYRIFWRLRRVLCRHDWKEGGHWAEGKTFVETMWHCHKCRTGRAFPMSDRTREQFFGEKGFMRNITLVEGSISDVLREMVE